jgi:sorting nexin-8
VMFLTVPTVCSFSFSYTKCHTNLDQELSVWRKQANLSVQEEFTGKLLPPHLEDSLPQNLQDLFDQVRSGVKRSADIYINLCNLLERLTKRNEGIAAEYLRFSQALHGLTESSTDTYAVDTNDVPLLNEGMGATARALNNGKALLEDEARAWDEGVLEDLKRQRDCLVSVRDMFERRDRYDRDNIPQLERRIANYENKLTTLRGKPEGLVKPGEIEKVEDAILRVSTTTAQSPPWLASSREIRADIETQDKQSIVAQHARGVFIKECIREELVTFQSSQYAISRLHQDWAQERVKYAELQADCWRSLVEQVEGMPLGD